MLRQSHIHPKPGSQGTTSASKSRPYILDYLAIFISGILIRLPFLFATTDDAFITFRYVRNIISGQGFVFNFGEHVLGTTTPLYTLYLAIVGKSGLDFVLVGKLTNIVADTAGVALLFLIVSRAYNRLVAWVVAIFILVSPYNLEFSASGMETGIYTFLILFVLHLYEQGQWKLMVFVGGAVVLVRPDGFLALLVIAIFWLVDRKDLKAGIKYAFLAGLIMLPWFIFATWYFGSPIPQSVTAKALTYRSSVQFEWLNNLWLIFSQRGGLGGSLMILGFLVTGSVSVLLRQSLRPLRIYLLWMVLYIATFTFFQSGRFGWYYSPIMPILFTFGVLGGAEWFEKVKRFKSVALITQGNLRYFLAGVFFLAILVISGFSVYSSWQNASKEVAFEKAISQPLGLCIKHNSSPSATVALESIGGVGWYSERYIWDEGGLVSTKTYALNQEIPGKLNVLAILQMYNPDFFVIWRPWELETLNTPNAQSWFEANYVIVNTYTYDEVTWTLFQSISSNNVTKNLTTNCQ